MAEDKKLGVNFILVNIFDFYRKYKTDDETKLKPKLYMCVK